MLLVSGLNSNLKHFVKHVLLPFMSDLFRGFQNITVLSVSTITTQKKNKRRLLQ